MEQLVPIIRLEIWLILGGLALIVSYQMLTGRINMSGLFDDKVTRGLSPGRVQLLVLTLAGAGYYLLLVAQQPPDGSFPPVPEAIWLLAGGGNLVYLAGKARSHLFR